MLDDYHIISDREIHDDVTFLLDHQPPQLHLVLANETMKFGVAIFAYFKQE